MAQENNRSPVLDFVGAIVALAKPLVRESAGVRGCNPHKIAWSEEL